jgi:hypothetical protein
VLYDIPGQLYNIFLLHMLYEKVFYFIQGVLYNILLYSIILYNEMLDNSQ